jgi:ribosome-associated protein
MAQLTSSASSEGPALLAALGSLQPRAKSLVRAVFQCLDDMKAEDVVALDLHGKTSIADVMVVASGRSNVHVGAIAERIVQTCKATGSSAPRVEGMPACDWVLIDAGDVIFHVFRPEARQFYNLEKMWGGDRPGETTEVRRAS